MNLYRRFSLAAILVSVVCGLASAQTGIAARPGKQESFTIQELPKPFTCPMPAALGDVSLRIFIDTKGNVTEAKALNGPEKLIPAAEACAKTWEFENPPSAPVTKNVAIRYDSKDCPAAESQRGDIQYSWGLRDRNDLVLAYVEGEEPPPLPYPEGERKAGAVGRMTLVVSLNMNGTVKDIHVLQGLSPRLNDAVMERIRPLKFKPLEGANEIQLQRLFYQVIFHATCPMQSVMNIE